MTPRISRGITVCSPPLKITNKFCSVWKLLLEDSFGNFVWKFRFEISFGDFVWKFRLESFVWKTDRPTGQPTERLLEAPWKFCLEISFGNFVWKTDRQTDRQTDRRTERLLEAPSLSLKIITMEYQYNSIVVKLGLSNSLILLKVDENLTFSWLNAKAAKVYLDVLDIYNWFYLSS